MDVSLADLAVIACDSAKWEQLRTRLVRYSHECELHEELGTKLYEAEENFNTSCKVMTAQEEEMMKLIKSDSEE